MSGSTVAAPVAERPETVPARRPTVSWLGITVLLTVLFALAVTALATFAPPSAESASAPAIDFSAARASTHVTRIAQRPHPTGSADNARVRRYIADTARAAGAEVTVESGEVLAEGQGDPVLAGTVHNVVARVPGTGGGKALLLVSHYDSVPTGPGAADDGAAVGAMLETIRALVASGGVRHDVVFLFTDGEELGSLGATLFVRRHGIDGYAAVLNWEARGSHGPVLMFETSQGNSALVAAFAGASSRPIGNSLAYEVYRRMPNDSDFTVFRAAGATGMNAAFIDGLHDYHSVTDTPERLSADSLQHHGETMLGMVRALGNGDSLTSHGSDTVYFDLFGRFLVHYPVSWSIGLGMASMVLLFGLLVAARRRSALTTAGLLAVTGVAFGVVIVVAALCFAGWYLVAALQPDLASLPLSDPYDSAIFVGGFAAITTGLLLLAARLVRNRSHTEVVGGVLLATGVLLTGCLLTAPGTSYLPQWPLVAGLPLLWLATRGRAGLLRLTLSALPVGLAIVLFAPVVAGLLTALGTAFAGVAMALAAVAGILLLPVVAVLPRTGLFGGIALALALVLLGSGVMQVAFSPSTPKPVSLVYVRDVSTGQHSWVSSEAEPDPWTTRALGEHPDHTTTSDLFPEFGSDPLLTAPAPAVTLDPPTAEVVRDVTTGDTRTVRFRVMSHRKAWKVQIRLAAGSATRCVLASTTVDTGPHGVVIHYFGDAGAIEMSCDLRAGTRLPVDVADFTIGHPPPVAALLGPRPDWTTPVAYGFAPEESSIVRQTTTL